MATDIKLDDKDSNWISIEAAVVAAHASDFMLETAARRTDKGGPWRRALVHGEDDSLIVNFAHDYPGGAHLNSAVLNLKPERQSTSEVALPKAAAVGDIKLIQNTMTGPIAGSAFVDAVPGNAQLWICVGQSSLTKEALWAQVQLGDLVVGTK
jgi:hypothetical protein